ncbi:MAG TPA: tetratricopeptide repeat protein, partial [Planctomycetia bacterium]|nr:tetratricopeptide repeat protein [Planctomycetia bacterium]
DLTAVLGREHNDTLTTLHNLARCHQAAGEAAKALPMFEEAARGVEKKRFDHPLGGMLITNVIAAHEAAGDLEKAIEWRRKLLAATSARFGAESEEHAFELAALGGALLQRKEWSEAEKVLRECLALRSKFDPDGWTVCNTRSALGGALSGLKRFADAEPLLVQGWEGLKRHEAKLPPTAKNRLPEALDRLVELYEATGKKEEAAKWRKEREAQRTNDAAAKSKRAP